MKMSVYVYTDLKKNGDMVHRMDRSAFYNITYPHTISLLFTKVNNERPSRIPRLVHNLTMIILFRLQGHDDLATARSTTWLVPALPSGMLSSRSA